MITLDSVSKSYSGRFGSIDALIDVSLQVERADIFGIVGFSGAGKSTLVRMVNRLENPDRGTITVDGQDVTAMRRKELLESRRNVGMVFQQFNLLETKTVFHNVAMPLKLVAGLVPKSPVGSMKSSRLSSFQISATHASVNCLAGKNNASVSHVR